MQREISYLLQLLRAFLHRQPASAPTGLDGETLLQLAAPGGLQGIVGYQLQSHPGLPDEETAALFSKHFYKTVFRYSRYGETLTKLRTLLAENDLPHALLKGGVLRDSYPVPELRSSGDIDVLLQPALKERVRELLVRQGMPILVERPDELVTKLDGVMVELHFALTHDGGNEGEALTAYLSHAADFTVEGEKPLWLQPDPTFHFIYLLSHQMRHFQTDSPGIRTFMDLAVFLQEGRLRDVPALTRQLEELGLYDYARRALTLTENWFSVPSPLPPAEMTVEEMAFAAEYILTAGLFAKAENRRAREVAEQKNTQLPRLSALFRAAFPPAKVLAERPQYARLAKTCLPLAWGKRFLNALVGRRGYITQYTKDVSGAADAAARRLRMAALMNIQEGGTKI